MAMKCQDSAYTGGIEMGVHIKQTRPNQEWLIEISETWGVKKEELSTLTDFLHLHKIKYSIEYNVGQIVVKLEKAQVIKKEYQDMMSFAIVILQYKTQFVGRDYG
jgi:hypothetical protein